MLIKLTIERTQEWVADQRLDRGDNIPKTINVDVDVNKLSRRSRQLLLEYAGGSYPEQVYEFRFSDDYTWCRYSGYGSRRPVVNSDEPTTTEIDIALINMASELRRERSDWLRKVAERDEKTRVDREAAAAKERQLAEARELLKDELCALKAQVAEVSAKRDVFASFLSSVDDDILRAALKSSVANNADSNIKKLQEDVENASPSLIIFGFDADDDQQGEG